jgi:hypothetical protein
MSLKAKFESHSVAFVLAIAGAAFASGWAAQYAVQSAAGRTSVSVESAKRIDSMDAERQAYIARIIQLEAMNRSIESDLAKARGTSTPAPSASSKEAPSVPRKALPSLRSREPHQEVPVSQVPVTVGDIALEGGPAQTTKVNSELTASVDYIVKPGYTVRLWITPSGGKCAYYYEPSSELSGSGRITRTFSSTSPCTVEELVVVAEHGDAGSTKILKTSRVHVTFVP